MLATNSKPNQLSAPNMSTKLEYHHYDQKHCKKFKEPRGLKFTTTPSKTSNEKNLCKQTE